MTAARLDARARLGLNAATELSPMETATVEEEAREHLSNASAMRHKFMCSSVVHDREEIKAALRDHFGERGQFALLLGGKNLGKSLLLKNLSRECGDIVGLDGTRRLLLYVDARSFSMDLAAGILAAVRQEEELFQKKKLAPMSQSQHLLEALSPQESPASILPMPTGTKVSIIEKQVVIASPNPPVMQLMDFLAQLAALVDRQGVFLCLIVDEANLAFPTPQDALLPLAQLADTQQLLQKLVQLTKQTNAMNVLLVSSDYAYPSRLRHGRFFNTTNLTETIFAGEVSPGAMRELLLHSWGLGPHLSDVFLAYYGGHVHMAAQALAKLSKKLDHFDCECVAPSGVLGSIVASLQGEGESGGPMTALLKVLARKGFAPVEGEGNAQAQILSLANVGGLVTTSSTVVGLAQGLHSGASFGVVPSSHFTVRDCPLRCAPRAPASPSLLAFPYFPLTPPPTHVSLPQPCALLLVLQRHLIAKALFTHKTSA